MARAAAGVRPAPPEADESWHPVARAWWDALAQSGQSVFYEASDWATALYIAEAMSRNLSQTQKFSATLFAAVMSASEELLVTEGARRRLRIELQRGADVDEEAETALASVTELAQHLHD